MYGGVTISSSKKAAINVTPTNIKVMHKNSQNVSETLKKLKKMQTGMTISKTTVPGVIPVRKCRTKPKYYADDVDDDVNGGIEQADDEDYDPNYDDKLHDDGNDYDNDNDHENDDYPSDDRDDDDEDYQPTGKKTKIVAKTKSLIKPIKSNTNASTNFKSIKINAPPVFLCMKCKNKFDSLAELKEHVFEKNACTTLQLTCKICDKTFDNRKRLLQHGKIHEEKPKYICDKCGILYTNQYNLENHKSSQHGEYLSENQNIYKCRLCSEKYTNRTDLYVHMKMHSKEKQQLLCDTCGKCFTNSYSLKSHQKVHLDIRPFSCTLCPKRFRSRLLLKQHMHVHTGIKEFQCNHCLQSFAKADSLRLHTRKRHPEVVPGSNKFKLTESTSVDNSDESSKQTLEPASPLASSFAPMFAPFTPIKLKPLDSESNDIVTQEKSTEIDA